MLQRTVWNLIIFLLAAALPLASHAQRVRFSDTSGSPSGNPATTSSTAPSLLLPASTTRMSPVTQGGQPAAGGVPQVPAQALPGTPMVTGGTPSAGLQTPAFDAFATQPPTGQPPVVAAPGGVMGANPMQTGSPQYIYPPASSSPIYVPNQALQGTPAPAQPNSLYPAWQPSGVAWPQVGGPTGQYLRLFEDWRLEHTYVYGNGGTDVATNDTLIGVTMNYPDFLTSGQPLKISPVFIWHFWSGPSPPVLTSDLPSRAFSTYLDLSWQTRQDVQFGGEIDFAFGVYSDYNSVTNNAVRFTGTGLGWLRITPNVTAKFGVEYYDRVDVKMLPAFGIFWNPNELLELDLYFPRPEIRRRLPQMGNTEVWFTFGAEYGGGSWVIQRTSGAVAGFSDQVDINEIRVYGGFEWETLRAVKGFFHAGYVFDRKLVYRVGGADSLSMTDSFMVRAGFAF